MWYTEGLEIYVAVSLIPFIRLPFFVLFPNDAHLSASLTAACSSSDATPVCQAHMGLHLLGLSFLIPMDFFSFCQWSSCCSWGSSFAHLFTPPLCQRWSHSTGSRTGGSPALQIIASVFFSTEIGDNFSSYNRLWGDWATGEPLAASSANLCLPGLNLTEMVRKSCTDEASAQVYGDQHEDSSPLMKIGHWL